MACNRVRIYPRQATLGVPQHLYTYGKIYGSNTSPTADLVELYQITSEPSSSTWIDVSFTNTVNYKYLIYKAASGQYTELSEIQFYNSTTLISSIGIVFAPAYSAGYEETNAFDGDLGTFYTSSSLTEGYIGIQTLVTVTADFTINNKPINVGQTLSLTDTSTGGSGTKTRVWKIDGVTVTPSNGNYTNPTFSSLSQGVHTIELTVTDDSGTSTKTISLYVGQITPSNSTVALGSTIEFTGTIASGTWSTTDDGSFSAGSTSLKKVYTPASVGVKNIKNTDTADAEKAESTTVTVYAPPVAGFSFNGLTDGNIRAGDTLGISDTSTGTSRTYSWKVNGVTVSETTATPNLTKYLKKGGNIIRQTVTNINGTNYTERVVNAVSRLINVGNNTSYNITGLSSGVTLIGKVKAVNNRELASDFSNSDEGTTS